MKVKRENNAEKSIAAYKTVLLDPLPGEEYNVHLCAKLLCGTVVKNDSIFSMNKIKWKLLLITIMLEPGRT